MRERHRDECVLVGFSTGGGTVMAASGWGEPGRKMKVAPPIPGSYEALFQETGVARFLLMFPRGAAVSRLPGEPASERSIGFIYDPDADPSNHYLRARLPDQFDAVIHFDRTRAVEALEESPPWLGEPAGRLDAARAQPY